jgi:hypothetical protein
MTLFIAGGSCSPADASVHRCERAHSQEPRGQHTDSKRGGLPRARQFAASDHPAAGQAGGGGEL